MLAALLAAGPAAPARAAGAMSSDGNALARSAVAGGGEAAASASYALQPAAGEAVAGSTAPASATARLGAGLRHVASWPGPVSDLAARGDVTASSATLTWTSPGVDGSLGALPAGSTYFIRVASFTSPDTFSDHRLGNVSVSTSGTPPGTGVGAGAQGLLANTTYWARLWTVDPGGNVSYASNISTFVTLALPVSLQPQSFVDVFYTSVTAHWVARPLSPPDASSKTAAGYVLEASSTNFGAAAPGGIVSSSTTWQAAQSTLTVSDPGLIVDRAYYFRVGALNWAGTANWTALGSVSTLFQINAPGPTDPPYVSVSSSALTPAWDRNGNPSDASYHGEVSTDPGFAGAVTTFDTLELSVSTAGLTANATYHVRVRASRDAATSDWLVLPATSTLAPPPEAAAIPFPAVHESSLTVRWLGGGNPAGVSTYTVVLTTEAFYPNGASGNVVLASTRPGGADPMATVAGLQPNTLYRAFAAALNWSGGPSGYVLAGSTATAARAPSSAGFEEIAHSSAAASWSTNGNPLGYTTFTVVMTTVAAYPPGGAFDAVASTLPTSSAVVLTVTGLRLNATYYLRVRAEGFARDSGYAAGGSTATRAVPPQPPAGTDYDPVATDSFTLNWSSGTADPGYDVAGTTYNAVISLNPGFSPALLSSTTFNVSAGFTGLSANTTYYARAAAFSHHTGTWTLPYSDFGSSATLAAVPTLSAPTFVRVHYTSMTVRWGRNGNPVAVTTYTVALSTAYPYPNETADTVLFSTAAGGSTPSATPSGLNSGTTYYVFVRALNHRGSPSAYVYVGSTRTALSPKTWVGGVDTSWHTGGNWSPSGVPGPNDAVTIAANVTVTAGASAMVSFSSLTVGNLPGTVSPTLVLSTGLAKGEHVLIRRNARVTQGMTQPLRITGDWTMESGALLDHSDNAGATLSAQVWVETPGLFDLRAGATVYATGRGYDGGPANGGQGSGPGAGAGSAASNGGGSGAGHGGAGGDGAGGGLPGGDAYDSETDPADAGSGGGGGDRSGGGVGGAGGGLIRVAAGTLALAGRIEADGADGAGGGGSATNRGAGGGGSGGAVNLRTGTLTGGGTVYALGGGGGADADDSDDPGGGGGGGRVALDVQTSGTACLIHVSTHGGASGGGASSPGSGGTFYSVSSLPAPVLAATAASSHSVTWDWGLVANGENYQLFDELDAPVSPLLGSDATEYVETGVPPNTIIARTVRVTACGAGTSSEEALAATLTSTPAVSAQPFLDVGLSSVAVTWPPFPPSPDELSSEGYRVEASTTDFGALAPGGVVYSAEAAGSQSASLAVPFLDPNTTYYFRIAGLNWDGLPGPYAAMGSTPTLALPVQPLATDFLGVFFTSITARWAARPSSPPDASSMTAAGYVVQASSTGFGLLTPGGETHSSATFAGALQSTLTVSEPPLSVDEVYYFRVAALNWAGRPNWTVLGGTRTRFQVNPPLAASPLFTDLSSAAITVRWDLNGNPADTRHRAEASASPAFAGVVTATDTYELSYSSGGLAANATYYFRVYATTRGNVSDWSATFSTVTHAPLPEYAAGEPFAALHESSFTILWSPGLNPPDVSSYTVVATTGISWPNGHAGNVVLSSTRPAGSAPAATFTGLAPNTEYYVFASALNWTGAPGTAVFIGNAATRPRPPSSAAFAELAHSSATVSFSLNGNPAGATSFRVTLSTVASFPPGGADDVSVDTVPASGPVSLPVTGLALDTTYYLAARTLGLSQDSAYATGGSSATRATPPRPSPDLPGYEPVSTSGFTLNWSSGAADPGYDRAGTTYYAQIAANPSFSPVLASSRTYNLSAGYSGLSVNTTYYARAAAFSHHHGTWTAYADFGSSATLAAAPVVSAPTFDRVHFTSMTVRWGRNGNPAGVTAYAVALSTSYPLFDDDELARLSTAPAGTTPVASPSGLNTSTTYYVFVRALNHRGAPTAYVYLGSTRTANAPKTWVGGVDTSWQTAGNWSPAGVPQATDAVTIAADVTVTAGASARISFSSLTVGDLAGTVSPTLVISTGIASGGSVLIRRGATVTQGTAHLLKVSGDWTLERGALLNHGDNSGAALSAQVRLDVAGTFDLQAGATVSASGLGYDGGPVNGGQGYGPGAGAGSSVSSGGGSGAGHGGSGGDGTNGTLPGGGTYGSFADPVDAGSGGGGGDASGTNAGGAGGGVVRITASAMSLAGLVEADGAVGGDGGTASATRGAGGGGSGGSVNLRTETLTGGGTVYALGGAGGSDPDGADDPGGGGGGGRVAIGVTENGTTCSISVSTHGGAPGGGTAGAGAGGTYSSTSTLPAPSLSAASVSSHTVTWEWSLVAGGDAYQVFDDQGGAVSSLLGPGQTQYAEQGLLPNTTYARLVRVTACGAGTDSPAASAATLTSTPTVVAQPFLEVWTASITASWQPFPGGTDALSSEGYRVEASTTDFGQLSPGGQVHASQTGDGQASSLPVFSPALDPNTTYYFRVAGLNWAGAVGPYAALGSTPTLSLPAGAQPLPFTGVFRSSVAAHWAARPASPPDASSMTAIGYVLEASSTGFSAGDAVLSSAVYYAAQSTLSIQGLDLSATWYFRVGTLNRAGRPGYSELGRLNFEIEQSTDSLSLGALNPFVARSTVATSSMVITNVGNWPATIVLSAQMATEPSSPWSLALSSGVESAVLWGIWDPGPSAPPPAAFQTVLSPVERVSQDLGFYAGGENGVLIPPGERRTLWFRFWLPTSTTSSGPERIRVNARARYP